MSPSSPPQVGLEESTQPPRAQTIRERLSRNSADLVPEQMPNGMTKLDLRGRFQQAAVVRLGADGKLERSCVDSAEALDGWMTGEHSIDVHPKHGKPSAP